MLPHAERRPGVGALNAGDALFDVDRSVLIAHVLCNHWREAMTKEPLVVIAMAVADHVGRGVTVPAFARLYVFNALVEQREDDVLADVVRACDSAGVPVPPHARSATSPPGCFRIVA